MTIQICLKVSEKLAQRIDTMSEKRFGKADRAGYVRAAAVDLLNRDEAQLLAQTGRTTA